MRKTFTVEHTDQDPFLTLVFLLEENFLFDKGIIRFNKNEELHIYDRNKRIAQSQQLIDFQNEVNKELHQFIEEKVQLCIEIHEDKLKIYTKDEQASEQTNCLETTTSFTKEWNSDQEVWYIYSSEFKLSDIQFRKYNSEITEVIINEQLKDYY